MSKLLYLKEPTLRFSHRQDLPHPKDGLTLFGPYTETPGSIRYGVIGTKTGINLFSQWTDRICKYIPAYKGSRFRTKWEAKHDKLAHQHYPGFQAVFKILWNIQPENISEIPLEVLSDALKVHDRNTRVARVAKVYAKRLVKLNYQSELKPDLWFVIVPRDVFLYCRPRSDAPKDFLRGTRAEDAAQYDLFVDKDETDRFFEEYQAALQFKPDFHNQLKARLLKHQIITQILQEDTIEACLREGDQTARDKQDPATIAWNLTTAIFYKTRRRPWILTDPRAGVCYLGLVFKRLNKNRDRGNACCGAQMFLEDGHGMVFKGALGPWYSEETKECHLDKEEAAKLLEIAIRSYADEHQGGVPREIFVHGSVRFGDDEWEGFTEVATRHGTRVTGIRIRKLYNSLKLFRRGTKPILRGTALMVTERKAFLWTTGFTPRLNTYPGWNVPNPLDIEICNGEGDLETILMDVVRLTKLNYNNCAFADGLPITLKFASKVGDILTTLPYESNGDGDDRKPLPFWHYI